MEHLGESVVKTYDDLSPEERARIAIEEQKDRNFDDDDNDNDIMSHLNYRKL